MSISQVVHVVFIHVGVNYNLGGELV